MHSIVKQLVPSDPCPEAGTPDLDGINRAWYSRPCSVSAFSADDLLEPALVLILMRYREDIVGQPVLDIGVGAGRTTLYLSRLTSRYVGIDYSAAMVSHCRDRFPGVRIGLCDVRDLWRYFEDGRFRFTVFSYNGIGAIDHTGRMGALAEIARVLEPGGVFAFSAHNRNHALARAGPRLHLSANPVTQAANVVHWLRRSRNHSRIHPFEIDGPEYALVNDVAEDYALLHYYITKEAQRRQLERVGLEVVEMYDRWSNPLRDGDADGDTPWIWYVARKTA